MKKIVSWLMCILLCAPALSAGTAQAAVHGAGDVIHGFALKEIGEIEFAGATTYLYEHVRSGAQLFYIQNGDIDRAFNIVFKTPALDDTGAPHVFEHAVISGSKKYPAQNLVFSLMNQTYNTFVNAMTGQTYTMYPVASLSEDQLLKLMDVYMDGLFYPMLLTEPRLVKREAWRYELQDKDAPITLNGTVYSEMKGALTLSRAAFTNLVKTLYPGSIMGNEPGGRPDAIARLTNERLEAFHEAYYHPANAMIFLYGDLEIERFLKALDEDYLSKCEKKTVEVERGIVPAVDQPVSAGFEFPVELTTPTENGSVIEYGFAVDGMEDGDLIAFGVLTGMLTHESSPLMKRVREELPGRNARAAIAAHLSTPLVHFVLEGANPEDAEVFQKLVDEELRRVSREGFDEEISKTVIANARFSLLMLPETQSLGVNMSASLGSRWSLDGKLTYFNDYASAIKGMEARAAAGDLAELVKDSLSGNERRALVVTSPAPGGAEAEAAELAGSLAEYKESLTAQEIQALVEETRAMAEWSAEEPPAEMVKNLQAVTVDGLPEEVRTYAITDETVDGVRRLSAACEVGEIGLTTLGFPSAFVKTDDIPYFALYADLIGTLPTKHLTREQVTQKIGQRLNGFGVSPSVIDADGKEPQYLLTAAWASLMDGYEADVQLASEVLFESDMTNVREILSFVKRARTGMRQSINMNPMAYQQQRLIAVDDPTMAYWLRASGIDYHRFLFDVEKALETDPEVVTGKLEKIQAQLQNRQGAVGMFVGNEEGIKASRAVLDSYFAVFPAVEPAVADYSDIPLPAEREAIQVDSKVQFNALAASLERLGVEPDGRYRPLASMASDMYLIPVLRHKMGVYTPTLSVDEDEIMLITYRDPNVSATYDVYQGIGDFLRSLSLAQEEVDPFILSSYSGFAMPQGQLIGASAALSEYLEGKTSEDKLEYMRQIKSLKAEDIAALSEVFDRLCERGVISTFGGGAAIEENKDLFDAWLKPFQAESAEEAAAEEEAA